MFLGGKIPLGIQIFGICLAAELTDGGIVNDPEDPGAELGPAAESVKGSVGLDNGILDSICCIIRILQNAIGKGIHPFFTLGYLCTEKFFVGHGRVSDSFPYE